MYCSLCSLLCIMIIWMLEVKKSSAHICMFFECLNFVYIYWYLQAFEDENRRRLGCPKRPEGRFNKENHFNRPGY